MSKGLSIVGDRLARRPKYKLLNNPEPALAATTWSGFTANSGLNSHHKLWKWYKLYFLSSCESQTTRTVTASILLIVWIQCLISWTLRSTTKMEAEEWGVRQNSNLMARFSYRCQILVDSSSEGFELLRSEMTRGSKIKNDSLSYFIETYKATASLLSYLTLSSGVSCVESSDRERYWLLEYNKLVSSTGCPESLATGLLLGVCDGIDVREQLLDVLFFAWLRFQLQVVIQSVQRSKIFKLRNPASTFATNMTGPENVVKSALIVGEAEKSTGVKLWGECQCQ